MEFSIGNISFSKEISKYNDSWYDWRSAEIAIPFLNGSKLQLILEFNDQELETIQADIEHVLRATLALGEADRKRLRKHLFAYYQDFVADVGEDYLEDMPLQNTDADIWDYVFLSSLTICQSSVTEEFFCQFTGGCDWESEHGVAISFRHGRELARVGSIGHVSNADARADPAMDQYIYYGNHIQTYADE